MRHIWMKARMFIRMTVTDVIFLAVLASTAIALDPIIGNVAFTATFAAGDGIPADRIVKFRDVPINFGVGPSVGYNPISGIFIAPKAGVYYFFVHGVTQEGKAVALRAYYNRTPLVSASARPSAGYASAGNAFTLRLYKGDQVYVKTTDRSFFAGNSTSTFTGFLLGTE